MKTKIAEIAEKFKQEMEEFAESEQIDADHAERYWSTKISDLVLEFMKSLYESADAALLADKKGRREAGLRVEHRNESRQVLTLLGELRYKRTYYRCKDGTYCHPIDELAGVESNQKVSGGVSLALANAALTMSYAKSSQVVTGGQVSRQTVLHKIRSARPVQPVSTEQRTVPALHIDADEDHVSMQNGKNEIVPLISSYEGIERHGKRGTCKNIEYYGQFGKKSDELWENVLTDIENRYDLEHTKIYLHGDGAPWIRQGLDWLPNSVFVLDPYHKNKAIKKLISGIPRSFGRRYEQRARRALAAGDREALCALRDEMLQRWPERAESITDSMQYLLNNLEGIAIFQKDAEAANGGATEPHISHRLSARLSSRPMGWSRATLERLVPLLAAGVGKITLDPSDAMQELPQPLSAAHGRRTDRRKVVPFSLGLPQPELTVSPPIKSGKVTQLFRTLEHFE